MVSSTPLTLYRHFRAQLQISLLGTGLGGARPRSLVDGTQSDLLMHDGSLLSGVTSAIQLGGKVLMGSANSPGLLLGV